MSSLINDSIQLLEEVKLFVSIETMVSNFLKKHGSIKYSKELKQIKRILDEAEARMFGKADGERRTE